MIANSISPTAVYFDFDNLISNDTNSSNHVWLERLIDDLRTSNDIVIMVAYADWQKLAAWQKTLEVLGVECVHVSSSTRGGKNSADVEAVVDVMEYVSESSLRRVGFKFRYLAKEPSCPYTLSNNKNIVHYQHLSCRYTLMARMSCTMSCAPATLTSDHFASDFASTGSKSPLPRGL